MSALQRKSAFQGCPERGVHTRRGVFGYRFARYVFSQCRLQDDVGFFILHFFCVGVVGTRTEDLWGVHTTSDLAAWIP